MDKTQYRLPHNQDFANFIKEKRLDMNMSSQEFADHVGLSRVTISNIENANINVGRYALEKLGVGFGKDYDYMRRVYKKMLKKYLG